MNRATKTNWKPWREEIQRFAARGSEGFDVDLKALKVHIKKLREVAPRDAGTSVPVIKCLAYLNNLQIRLDAVESYLARSV